MNSYFANRVFIFSLQQAHLCKQEELICVSRAALGSCWFPSYWNVLRWALHIMPLEPGVSHTGCCFVSFLQPVINTSRQSAERKAVEYSTAERHREKKWSKNCNSNQTCGPMEGSQCTTRKEKKFLKLWSSWVILNRKLPISIIHVNN